MDQILAGLNAAQYEAVTSSSPVLQILAPPGSGKTKTLTSRVAYLLSHHGYKPQDVLCLTFTIKSAEEMKERLGRLLGKSVGSKLMLGTFHSVCRRYLAIYGHFIGLRKDFGIADTSDTSSIIKRIIKRLNSKIDPGRAQSRISASKSRGILLTRVENGKTRARNLDQEFVTIFEEYQAQLESSNLLDYDDLLLKCVDLLQKHPECVSNVEAVLIDEFQDTNVVQFNLMRLFAARNQRVTTVGDPDQSIYGWRSAEVKNLGRMQNLYLDTLVIHLEENYRSSGAILLAASEVIEQDDSRPARLILPTHCLGTAPVLRSLPTTEAEAIWIVSEIRKLVGLTGGLLRYDDFSILLRSASLSRQVEAAMGKAGIPYRMVGGQKFFDRVEVKILLDYLRVISQPNSNDALGRIVNVPSRRIGATTIKVLLDEAESRKSTMWAIIQDTAQYTRPQLKISKQAQHGLATFTKLIHTFRRRLQKSVGLSSIEDLTMSLIENIDFRGYLKKSYEIDYENRWANVEELLAQASEYTVDSGDLDAGTNGHDDILPLIEENEKEENTGEEVLSRFLANVALATEHQRLENANEAETVRQRQVTVSTIHAAKGLEWPVVFVPSAYEGCIPHSRAEDMDEERRLLYVAMTRAQALLYISCPETNSQSDSTSLSSFLGSEKAKRFFTSRSPTLNLTTLMDISQILRRSFTCEKTAQDLCESLGKYPDNIEALGNEDGSEESETKRHQWETTSVKGCKRQQSAIDDVYGTVECDQTRAIAKISFEKTTVDHMPMGFVSAATHLNHTIQGGQNNSAKKVATRKRPHSPGSIVTDRRANISVRPYGNMAEQTNTRNCWGSQSNRDGLPGEMKISSSSLAQILKKPSCLNKQELSGNDYKRSATYTTGDQLSCEKISSLNDISIMYVPEQLVSHGTGLDIIADNVDSMAIENSYKTKHYAFLSSSPPAIEEKSKSKDVILPSWPPSKVNSGEAGETVGSIGSTKVEKKLGFVNNRGKAFVSDLRPAKTFHNTSVARVNATSTSTKRTLGIRRSIDGWASRRS